MADRLVLFTNSAELFLSHRQHLAQGAVSRGFEVIVICPPSPAVKTIVAAGYQCETVPLGRNSVNPLKELRSLFCIWQVLRRLKPQVIHNFTIKCVLYGTLAARATGCRQIVNTVTGRGHVFLDSGLKAWTIRGVLSVLYRIAFRAPQIHFVFQNADDRDLYVTRGWVAEDVSEVIPGTGVDTERFAPAPEPDGPVRILFAGRFLREKGLRELVRACDQLHKEKEVFQLMICGWLDMGNPSAYSQEDMERIARRPYVQIAGQRKDMENVYRSVHVVCLPSYGEGLPLTLVEAAAAGKPLVATDVPGCREVVENNKNGFLVELGNITALALALRTLIRDRATRDRFSRASRDLALKRFAKAHVVEAGLKIYSEERKVA